jgi:hypothetical protein
MTMHFQHHKLSLRAVFALAALTFAGAQEGPQRIDMPRSDAEREMLELFGKVERKMREIDKLLSDASAGDTSALEKVGPSGIDEILKRTQETGREVREGIDKILEIARQMNSQSSSGQGSPSQEPKPGQGSPLDQRGEQSTQREQTPGGREPQGQEPKPGGEDPQGKDKPEPGKQPNPGGQDPKDPRASPDKNPKNERGNAPPGSSADAANNANDQRSRWGELPTHARDVFQTQGGKDMPPQYRDWIDAYYRRLNKKP